MKIELLCPKCKQRKEFCSLWAFLFREENYEEWEWREAKKRKIELNESLLERQFALVEQNKKIARIHQDFENSLTPEQRCKFTELRAAYQEASVFQHMIGAKQEILSNNPL